MKRIVKKLCLWYLILLFGLSPVILLVIYLTYSERIVIPILIFLLIISSYVIFKEN